jgi:hypothetical protein
MQAAEWNKNPGADQLALLTPHSTYLLSSTQHQHHKEILLAQGLWSLFSHFLSFQAIHQQI